MTLPASASARYQSDFDALRRTGASRPSWFNELRAAGWERFSALGFPTARRGNERWKYTNVAPIARADFNYSLEPGPVDGSASRIPFAGAVRPGENASGWSDLVFVDGLLSPELSNATVDGAGLTVGGVDASVSGADNGNTGEEIRDRLGSCVSIEDDGFAALNTAFLHDGAFVRVPDGHSQRAQVRLTYITTGHNQPKITHPRSLVVVGSNAELTLVEAYAGPAAGRYFTNAVTEVVVGDGARVDHYRLLTEGADAFHVGTSRVRQAKDSTFNSASFALGAALARNDMEVIFDAAGCYCSLDGLYLTADNQHVDNLISIDHAKPHCTSRLNYKGILDGRSKAVFGGTVTVRKDAQKSDAKQTDKNLLLSDHAEVDSKPSLLIYADDVKCSHGATAGHIDQDTLFYLRSRGLDLSAASRMLVHAFASEIIDAVNPGPLREYLDSLFHQAIPEKSLPVGRDR